MQAHVRTRILAVTQADDIGAVQLIQPLWNNYGTLSRVHLVGGTYTSVIVKHIKIPHEVAHPRGLTSSISKQRKLKSYGVETHWYGHHNQRRTHKAPTPECLDVFDENGELFLLLQDLGTAGFTEVIYGTSLSEVEVVLRWLAHFHAQFLSDPGEGLWASGTYWHLQTRPEELANIEGTQLHRFAGLLDARLRCAPFQTLVHGDAKLANFLFSEDHSRVAGVDFQYVGRGCAMKDVAYFLGSCLSGSECEGMAPKVLDLYFKSLCPCLPDHIDTHALEREWRSLYPVAWADFQRFMLGWSPGHRKLTPYSDATTKRAIDGIAQDLMGAAKKAALVAGHYIQTQRHTPLDIQSKGFESRASDVVTQIDVEAQRIILEILAPTIERYDLGVLAEEGPQDQSRLTQHAFWTIDPLDGTQCFIDGKSGYATSIALVSQSGEPILGVVYDSVHDTLFESAFGQGVTRNGVALKPLDAAPSAPTKWYADQSLRNHSEFERLQAQFDIRFVGGAVMNIVQLLTEPNSVYIKPPKKKLGGCAIWDLAAVSLMLTELGGTATHFDGATLNLNRPNHMYFNDVGLVFTSPDVDVKALRNQM